MSQAREIGMLACTPLGVALESIQGWERLSQGAESQVFTGIMDGKEVAIKKPVLRNSKDLERFRTEIKILSTLSHPNIVSLLGARMLPPQYFIVMPNMGENLHTLLHDKGWRPTWVHMLEIGVQLAGALQAVHDAGIVHRDIKTKNILKGSQQGVQLIDFGVAAWLCDVKQEEAEPMKAVYSRGKPTGGFHKARIVGTVEYMAPEILNKQPFSKASDVYALAVTLNELATSLYPFSDCTKDNPDCHTVLEMGYGRQELCAAVAAEGLRPTLPKMCPAGYSKLMRNCWQKDPALRPTMTEVRNELQELLVAAQESAGSGQLTTKQARNKSLEVSGPVVYPLTTTWELLGNALPSIGLLSYLQSAMDYAWKMWGMSSSEPWIQHCVHSTRGYLPTLTLGGYETAGRRGEDRMEDRHFIMERFMGSKFGVLFGVYDGHRGFETAQFAFDRLPDIVEESLVSADHPETAFKNAYLQLEDEYEASGAAMYPDPKGTRFPGCTALTALVWQDKLVIANAGDSRAVLCRDGQAIQVTRDHTAMDNIERRRIQMLGADVLWVQDSWRVGKAGIQVTRSLGDIDLKAAGVTAEPEVTVLEVSPNDGFLVLASDGLWDSISNEEAIEIIKDTVKHPDMCAKRLVTEAISRGSHDNISVIVAFLQPVSTIEKVFSGSSGKRLVPSPNHVGGVKKHRTNGPAADEVMVTC